MPRFVVEACPGCAERDIVAVVERLLPVDPLPVDISPVETPEIAEHVRLAALLDEAVLLRDDFIEELDRVRRMATQRVLGAQVYDLLTFRCCEQKTRHLKIQRLSLVPRQYNRKPIQAARYSLRIYSVGARLVPGHRRGRHPPYPHTSHLVASRFANTRALGLGSRGACWLDVRPSRISQGATLARRIEGSPVMRETTLRPAFRSCPSPTQLERPVRPSALCAAARRRTLVIRLAGGSGNHPHASGRVTNSQPIAPGDEPRATQTADEQMLSVCGVKSLHRELQPLGNFSLSDRAVRRWRSGRWSCSGGWDPCKLQSDLSGGLGRAAEGSRVDRTRGSPCSQP